ncbi:MAG TPA: 3-keto-5-aminohexanoate cleavage protein [Ramlibacter sp.]|nr:3-keto-5-aminohexanoate cleavage protein [Ramlibacter sp.]
MPSLPGASRTPAVLCVAPNGARRTHADHPALPITAHQLARDAAACHEAGASVIHLHVRDEQGRHSLDIVRYREAIAAIEAAVGDRLLVQVTTEAIGMYAPADQMQLVRELRPEAASVALRELAAHEADLPAALEFFAWARRERIALQYIVYSAEEARRLASLAQRGLLAHRAPNALFVLGRYAANQQSAPTDLLPFLQEWPADWPWSVCAFGAAEAQCMAAAIGLGGHARVGFENNLHRPDGTAATGNADLVANARTIVQCTGRSLATADEARRAYGAAGC